MGQSLVVQLMSHVVHEGGNIHCKKRLQPCVQAAVQSNICMHTLPSALKLNALVHPNFNRTIHNMPD